jgi:hypothetical protein
MVPLTRFVLGCAALAVAAMPVASAQSVISARSGLVHYVEGRVFLNDQLIEPKFGEFPQLKENQELRNEDGRAEVLLTPGVFLRIAENSAVRMVNNRLIDTRVEFLSGEALLQVDELLQGNSITIAWQDYTIRFLKSGVYRLSAEPAELRVYDGEASVALNGETKTVKEGHALAMDGGFQLAKFDKNDVDDLYRWSRLRSQYIAMANVSSAKTLWDTGMYWGMSGWYWNPFFGMYTFVPFGGMFYDPWGFAFWSPFTVGGYLGGWPGYYPVGGSGSGSGSGSGTHHPPGRIGHPPVPRHPHGNQPAGVPRGVTLAATAQRSVSTASGGHAGGFSGGLGHVGGAAGGGFSGGSSGGGSHGGSAGSSGASGGGGASAGGGGGHK